MLLIGFDLYHEMVREHVQAHKGSASPRTQGKGSPGPVKSYPHTGQGGASRRAKTPKGAVAL